MTKIRLGEVLAVIGILAFLAAILLPVFVQSKGGHMKTTCVSNLRRLGSGEFRYASDHDDRFAPGAVWMDATDRYVGRGYAYRCPKVPSGSWGYAFDRLLGGESASRDSSDLPMIYDSTDLSKNANDRVTSLPNPGRHLAEDGKTRSGIVYADGHARWEPR